MIRDPIKMTDEKFTKYYSEILEDGKHFAFANSTDEAIIICNRLNWLNKFKNKFKQLSTDAHNYLRCYEKAISELYDKYPDDSQECKVLDELDELYSKYEKDVG